MRNFKRDMNLVSRGLLQVNIMLPSAALKRRLRMMLV